MNPQERINAILEKAGEIQGGIDRLREKEQASTVTDTPAANSNQALIDALTERVSNQGQGIATSTSSSLQASINEAM